MIGLMTWSLVHCGLLSSTLLVSGTGINIQSTDPDAITSGRIMLIKPRTPKGALQVKQGKHLKPVNAVEGMLIRRGYILILSPKARAAVICADGKKHELAPGPQGCPCTTPCTPGVCGIYYGASTIGTTRGSDTADGEFPVVISPRKTMLRSLRPIICWAPVADAKRNTVYRVTLYGEDMKAVWERDVTSATGLPYPDKEPALQPGQTYKVVVTTGVRSSEQENSPGLGFTTLTTDQARSLSEEETRRRKLRLPDAETRFLISNSYAVRNLYSEAIDQLQDPDTMKGAAVAAMLGNLYATVGLNREAERKYLEALTLTSADDLDGLGSIRKNLAQAYESLGIYDKAIANLKWAIKAYRKLGLSEQVRELAEKELRLERARRRG